MQLKLTRAQRDGGVVSKSVIFCINARVELSTEEQANVRRYKLGSQVIYNSEASKRHLDRANARNDGTFVGGMKSLASLTLAAMKLNITIDGLQNGQHIECKTLEELLAAEEALITACQYLKNYLDKAITFDGREVLIDFRSGAPEVVLAATSTGPFAVSVSSAAPPAPLQQLAPPPATNELTNEPTHGAPIESEDLSAGTAGVSHHQPNGGFDFDRLQERLRLWWTLATVKQRAIACTGAAIVCYTLYQIF